MKEPEVAAKAGTDAPTPTLAWKAAIDFNRIKENPDAIQANADNRAAPCDVAKVVSTYDRYKALNRLCDEIREKRNANAKSMKGKMEADVRAALVEEGKALKDQLAAIEGDLNALEVELQLRDRRSPTTRTRTCPSAARRWRCSGARWAPSATSPSRWPTTWTSARGSACSTWHRLQGLRISVRLPNRAGAMLELALINWAMQKVVSKGFKPMVVPDLVRQSTMEKCGFQPRAENTQVYNIESSELCLAGTAEILLGGVYMDEVVDEKQLPIKMAAFSHCFRTEAGAAGASTRGMYRLHQFSKVEMFVVSTPEQSDELHDELIGIEEEMYRELGFHFKVLDMSSEDLGAPAYRKFDIEAWMPALERYGEISSASNCTDYQARRLNIKYRPNAVDGKKQPLAHCHTLNATACAVPRMIITILENFQNEDGSVNVPEPLQPFMGGLKVLTPEVVAEAK